LPLQRCAIRYFLKLNSRLERGCKFSVSYILSTIQGALGRQRKSVSVFILENIDQLEPCISTGYPENQGKTVQIPLPAPVCPDIPRRTQMRIQKLYSYYVVMENRTVLVQPEKATEEQTD
jgi:hypothetical protein